MKLKNLTKFSKKTGKFYLAFLVFVIFCLLYYWSYLHNPGIPKSEDHMGFMGAYDPSRYLMIAQVFPKLTKREFAFGIGYPLLAVPFRKINPLNPFFIPNMILGGLTAVFTFLIVETFTRDSKVAIFSVLLLFLATPMLYFTVRPFNTTVVTTCCLMLFYLTLTEKFKYWHFLLAGLAIYFPLSARYIDFVWLLPTLLIYFVRALGNLSPKKMLVSIFIFSLPFLIGVPPIAYYHKKIHGCYLCTPFSNRPARGIAKGEGTEQDWRTYHLEKVIPSHIEVFIQHDKSVPAKYRPRGYPLLVQSPILFLVPSGLFFSLKKLKKYRADLIAIITGLVLAFAFYGSSWSYNGYSMRYNVHRYVIMWFPYFMTFVGVLVNEIVKVNSAGS